MKKYTLLSDNDFPLEGSFGLLIPELRKAISEAGYEQATPIQEACIPPLLEGRDLIGTAQTGTGKTAAFTLPLLHALRQNNHPPKAGLPHALILAPTRELAAQIGDSIKTYGRYLHVSHTVIFGGVKQHRQVQSLRDGVDIVVATPGRLLDLMQQGHLRLSRVQTFILDEVDRMLDMGFLPDIRRILKELPNERHTLFLSATMHQKMLEIANTMVHRPVHVSIEPESPTVEKISQKLLFVDKKNKNPLLISALKEANFEKAIIFTQMKHVANRLVDKLKTAGIESAAIHGNKSQGARTRTLKSFKDGSLRVLIATDVAARGLDVDDITHVFNYDLPIEAETYVHRIGRTARAGSSGDSISFCTADERDNLKAIERLIGKAIPVDTSHQYHCDKAQTAKPAPHKKTSKPTNSGRRRSGGKNTRNTRGRSR